MTVQVLKGSKRKADDAPAPAGNSESSVPEAPQDAESDRNKIKTMSDARWDFVT